MVESGELEQTQEWAAIEEAWREAAPLALAKWGRTTTAQRDAAKKHLEHAVNGAAVLVSAGRLSEAERHLLAAEAERIIKSMYRYPPQDSSVRCYRMAYLPPVRQSMARIRQRLPILERLVKDGTIHRAVTEKVLPTIEADIEMLSRKKEMKKVTALARIEMEETRRQARTAADAVRKLL